ncbi:MAG: hypothetical protein K0B14_19055, partial [Anaerolineaceae bacterium]|nr:hypothetical protein [Anaerolineaceae bacterium]
MLEFNHQTPIVSLSGDPVHFRFLSDSSIESVGVPASLTLVFGSTGRDGEALTISWGIDSVSLVFRDEPDDSGFELSSGAIEPLLSKWTELVAREMASNYLINRYYSVSSLGGSVTFTARQTGNEYSLRHEATGIDGIWFSSIAGSDSILRPFFKVGVQVVLGAAENSQILGEEYLPVDVAGSVTFDLHDFFSDSPSTTFSFPEAADNLGIIHPESCREYYVRYFEQYGTPPIPRKINTAGPFYVLNGALSTVQEGRYRREGSDFWSKLCYNQYFLTWQPKVKTVDRYQVEKLFYLVRDEYPFIVMRVETYFVGGISTNPVPKCLIETPVKMGVYEFICSLSVLQLDGWDTEFIDYYEVWIEDDQVNRISEIRRFYVNQDEIPFVRYFLFRNSIGGWDTLRTSGKFSPIFEYERSTAIRIPGLEMTDQDHRLIQTGVAEEKTYSASTGWLTREQMDWIRDFCLSGEIYEVQGQNLIPVVLTSKTARQAKDGENLWFLDFEYTRSVTDEYYTREVVGAPFDI